MQIPASLRLGCVKYLNALPLIHGWEGAVTLDHPAALCRQLAAGELDAALVSSFEYLRRPIYYVVDGVAVASDGPVFSVILVHRGPVEQLREVLIDPASATSVNLLRCLLGKRGIAPAFISQGEISNECGRLLIGDQAIRFRREREGDDQILDLGAEWKDATGRPFVYALWLIRPEYPEKETVAHALRSLGQKNLARLDRLISAQPERSRAFCEFYFRECLHFALGEEEKEGFRIFGELCAEQKLLPAVPPAPRLV
ncbi:MAG: menaquinone biosynthesis protein [Chthoniobacterales bacterium]